MVAAALRQEGYDVDLIDADADNLTMDETADRILEFKPDAVGISCNYITKHNPTYKLAQLIKQRSKTTFVFAGGNHAAAYSEGLLDQNGPIDVVLTGEGEAETPALLKAISETGSPEGVPGAAVYKDGTSRLLAKRGHVDVLDSLPLAAYDLLPMEKYRRFELVTSRGCPYTCSFCASTEIVGTKVRLRTPENVAMEIKHLRETYGDRFLWISDDTFTAIKKHAVSISAAIQEFTPPVKWSCFSTAVTLNSEVLTAMKASGCEYTSIGVETTHPSQKRYVGKRVNDQFIADTVKRCHDHGLRVYGFIIVGFPGETMETLESRYTLIEKAGFDDVGVNMLIPLPGTMIWHELVAAKLFDPKKLPMDYLFARVSEDGNSQSTAALTASWTNLTTEQLIDGVNRCREIGRAASPNYVPRNLAAVQQQVCA
jgi:radical SAM superfamily enzyme YgiQ (UPF0313 family)